MRLIIREIRPVCAVFAHGATWPRNGFKTHVKARLPKHEREVVRQRQNAARHDVLVDGALVHAEVAREDIGCHPLLEHGNEQAGVLHVQLEGVVDLVAPWWPLVSYWNGTQTK